MGPGNPYPPTETQAQASTKQDTEHLSLLGVFWKIYSALALLLGCFGLVYIAMGAMFASSAVVPLQRRARSPHSPTHASQVAIASPPDALGKDRVEVLDQASK